MFRRNIEWWSWPLSAFLADHLGGGMEHLGLYCQEVLPSIQWTTGMIERVKRITIVVRVFGSNESCTRLEAA